MYFASVRADDSGGHSRADMKIVGKMEDKWTDFFLDVSYAFSEFA